MKSLHCDISVDELRFGLISVTTSFTSKTSYYNAFPTGSTMIASK